MPPPALSKTFKQNNKEIAKKVLAASVIKNALKTVGTKPSRILNAMGAKNNQETSWHESLDADNLDVYRTGMAGCLNCPVRCRPLNDMTPEGKGGWGANALRGLAGNAIYDQKQADTVHQKVNSYRGIKGDGKYDRYDKGDGPEYVTLQKMARWLGSRNQSRFCA